MFYHVFIHFNLSIVYRLFLSTVYQLFTNFLSIFVLSTVYQPLYNCFSFMSYISALPNIIFALHSLCSIDQCTFASYVAGAPQLRSPPIAANMHFKMILNFVYPHCLMHPPQHLMYSLNFHQAKQGPPHQQTLSDQLQLHATCRPNLRVFLVYLVCLERNKRTWRPDYLYQLCSPQVFINAEVFDRRKLSTEAKG